MCYLCLFLIFVIILLLVKILLMRKSIKEISIQFTEILNTDTNKLISISSNDKAIKFLANSINKQLKTLRKEHIRYMQGDRELKTAITNIAHDIRTPLTAIYGYLDLMQKNETPEKNAYYLSIMKNRAELMKQLTEELFCYSVMISGNFVSETEEVSINQVLEDSIMGYYAVLTEKEIFPEIHLTEKPIKAKLNKEYLSRIFSNLLNNAVKYSDGDLKITLTDDGEIIFTNTAEKLSSVQVERIFDRFYTVETARNSTGLGLSIAKMLAEEMHGILFAEYKNNKLSIKLKFPENK